MDPSPSFQSPDEVRQTRRPPYTLLAWLAPVVTPLLFALGVWSGLVGYGMKLISGFPGSRGVGAPMIMFMFGWIGLTIACAGWIAWQMSVRKQGAARLLVFILLWPVLAAGLGVAGAAVGFPACMAADQR